MSDAVSSYAACREGWRIGIAQASILVNDPQAVMGLLASRSTLPLPAAMEETVRVA